MRYSILQYVIDSDIIKPSKDKTPNKSGKKNSKKTLDKFKNLCYSKYNERRKENKKQMNKDAKRDTMLAILAILCIAAVVILENIL